MDLNKIGLHIHEIRNQLTYIEGNIGILNQSLEKNSSVGVFMCSTGSRSREASCWISLMIPSARQRTGSINPKA